MSTALLIATLLLLLVTLLPLFKHPAWWIRIWDFPRLQILLLGLLLLAANLWHWQPTAKIDTCSLIISLILVLYQGIWIFPYTPLAAKQVKAGSDPSGEASIRVMVSNVLTPNRQAHRLLALVEQYQPDILVAVETDQWWEQQLQALESRYPWRICCPKDNLYGMHVYSAYPLSQAEILNLVDKDIPSMHMHITLPNGVKVRLHSVHPMPPSPTENLQSDDRDAELILVGRSVANSSLPVIVTGDLNDVAWSRSTRLFLKISGLMDPRRGRGMYCTFHAGYPFLRWPLDHVFHSKQFVLAGMRRLSSIGSDHYPFMVDLVYHPEVGKQQQSLEKVAADEQDANKILERVKQQ